MKWTKETVVIIAGMLALVLVLVFKTTGERSVTRFYDDSGQTLESLFYGIVPDWDAWDSVLHDGASSRGSSIRCQDSFELVRHLSSWINPPSVAASSCGSSVCSGHYMYYEYRPCGFGCSTDGGYGFFYSDPQKAPWQNGRQDIGSLACLDCPPCAEMGCVNW